MNTKDRIIKESRLLFQRRGIRGVTMDEISREMGMSKKTLYQHFGNKAELVQGVVADHFEQEMKRHEQIEDTARDPVEEMLMHLQAAEKTFSEIPSVMIYEIQKYYPKAWAQFDEFKNSRILDAIRSNLHKGVELGLFRKDMDVELVARLRLMEFEMILRMDHEPTPETDPSKLQMELFRIFLHGVVTMRGKKLIYKYLNQPEDE